MKEMDVVTFGETMVLFSSEQFLPLEYVHQLTKQIGGAESNVAIGLQRLGHSVGWFSKLGNDPFGRYILHMIRGEGVDTSRCLFTNEAPTGVFFKEKRSAERIHVYYYRRHSAASLLQPEELDEGYIAQAKILHITGITPALSSSCRATIFKAIEIAKKYQVKIVFDPNIRFKLWSNQEARDVLTNLCSQADVILPGLEEGQWLTGKEKPDEIVKALRKREDQLFIVKLGKQGAYYDKDDVKGSVEGFPVEKIVDPIGAGDGFAAGIISGLLQGMPLEETVKLANAVGALVVGVPGDVEGLPSWKELEEFLQNNRRQDVLR